MSSSFPTGTGLVVPLRLEALMVGSLDNTSIFVPGYADFTGMAYQNPAPNAQPTANLSQNILFKPFQGETSLLSGVHLHWNLPRALRIADFNDGSGAMTAPAVPNRWLVTRTTIDVTNPQAPKTAFSQWVVESDYVASSGTYSNTAIPCSTAAPQDQPWQYIGRVYPSLDDWLSNGQSGTYASPPLTALGFGVPDFASCYANCQNVFGMRDASPDGDAAAGSTTILAYSVTGWYSDPANDPLAGSDASQVAAGFGWTYDAQAGTPSFTLCHGMVYGLSWNADGQFITGGTVTPSVTLGNTPADAFAAYAAATLANDGLATVEPILNALQLGLLPNLGQPDGSALLADGQFNAAFTKLSGGTTWTIRSTPGADTLAAGSSAVQDMATLLATQDTVNQLSRRATGLQGQIFADWCKFMMAKYDSSGNSGLMDSIMGFINDEIATLNGWNAQIATATATGTGTGTGTGSTPVTITQLQQAIVQALPPNVTLVASNDGRFYEPNDPVILLTGNGIPAAPPEDAGTIGCVLTTAFPSSVTLPADLVASSAGVALPVSALPAPTSASTLQAPLPEAISLAQADLLLMPVASAVVTQAVAALGGTGNAAVADFAGTEAAIAAAQQAWLAGSSPSNGVALGGQCPSPAIAARAWALPWQPIGIAWQCSYAPLQPLDLSTQGSATPPSYAPDVVTGNFTAATALPDFTPTTTAFGSTTTLQGTALLSSNATTSLQNAIGTYLQYNADPELQTILTDLGATPVLAQALSGFSSKLLMLDPTLQFPVSDPCATDPLTGYFTKTAVAPAVGGQNLHAPNVEFGTDLSGPVYNPLRAGQITITQLNLIDEFGRFQAVDLGTVNATQAMPRVPPSAVGQTSESFLLPLRLAQPARLNMRWLSAADPTVESSGFAATNPICGWVVPNTLDDSLMYYDASGDAIGSQTVADTVVWQVAPNAGTPGQGMEQSFTGRNPTLAAFAAAVQTNGPAALTSLLRTIAEAQVFVQPQTYQLSRQTALLMGTPLALVQADLQLELQALPSPDQSFAALSQDMASGDQTGTVRTTRGLEQVNFPVLLGDADRLNDGLIGFFLSKVDGSGADFSTFYAATADGSSSAVVKPSFGTLQVALDDATPTLVAMLMDPRAAVHVTTGILPVMAQSLPADLCTAALSNMSFSFLTAPVIAPAGSFAIPVPQEGTGTWTWVTYQNGAWTSQSIAPPSALATLQRPQGIQEGWLQLVQSEETN